MKKAVIVSGYFNPLHKGHIEYFKLAKAQADVLFVIVNNDFQKGDKIIIISYARMNLNEAKTFDPTLIFPNNDNLLS